MGYICKTPIVLIFFNRPDTLAKVFERVKAVTPSRLYLVQDGPRNEADLGKIEKCREIVEHVDWPCEVFKNYAEQNLGCGVRPQSGITWAFEREEQLIILEDDCVAEETFFPYCEEMLERFRNDERICYVSGLNHFKEWECGENDYFFTKTGAIAAWATWKRAWNQYDYYVKALEEKYVASLVKNQITDKYIAQVRMNALKRANASANTGEKLSYWDAQWGFVKYSQNMLVVVPRYNQITNIGVGISSTHAASMKKEKYVKYKNFVFIPTRKLEFPLRHPRFLICDTEYDSLVYKCSAGNPIRRRVGALIKKLLRFGKKSLR